MDWQMLGTGGRPGGQQTTHRPEGENQFGLLRNQAQSIHLSRQCNIANQTFLNTEWKCDAMYKCMWKCDYSKQILVL